MFLGANLQLMLMVTPGGNPVDLSSEAGDQNGYQVYTPIFLRVASF
jgi:hypothetical protein